MTTPFASQRCTECGAGYRPGAKRCWLCGAKLPEEPIEALVLPEAAADANTATFSLSSLFLVVTLVAVGAGIAAAAPGLGVLFVIVATPALVRTIVVASRQKARGVVTTPTQKVVAFLASVGMVLLVILSIGVALFTACLTACASFAMLQNPTEQAIRTAIVVGGLVGLAVATSVLWLVWRGLTKGRSAK
jgi:hypothetical protein